MRLDFARQVLEKQCPEHQLTVPHEEKQWVVAEFRQVAEFGGIKYYFQACRGLLDSPDKPAAAPTSDRVAAFIFRTNGQIQTLHLVWGETAEIFGAESFEAPEAIKTKNGIVLVVPHPTGGNGGFDGDFFLLEEKKITLLESETWAKEFNAKLPKGLWLMNRLYPNFHEMAFTTALWREKEDSHARPTGGKAKGTIAIEGNRIVLKSVSFDLAELPAK